MPDALYLRYHLRFFFLHNSFLHHYKIKILILIRLYQRSTFNTLKIFIELVLCWKIYGDPTYFIEDIH